MAETLKKKFRVGDRVKIVRGNSWLHRAVGDALGTVLSVDDHNGIFVDFDVEFPEYHNSGGYANPLTGGKPIYGRYFRSRANNPDGTIHRAHDNANIFEIVGHEDLPDPYATMVEQSKDFDYQRKEMQEKIRSYNKKSYNKLVGFVVCYLPRKVSRTTSVFHEYPSASCHGKLNEYVGLDGLKSLASTFRVSDKRHMKKARDFWEYICDPKISPWKHVVKEGELEIFTTDKNYYEGVFIKNLERVRAPDLLNFLIMTRAPKENLERVKVWWKFVNEWGLHPSYALWLSNFHYMNSTGSVERFWLSNQWSFNPPEKTSLYRIVNQKPREYGQPMSLGGATVPCNDIWSRSRGEKDLAEASDLFVSMIDPWGDKTPPVLNDENKYREILEEHWKDFSK